jgi:predicted PurR-regulated permease PerM
MLYFFFILTVSLTLTGAVLALLIRRLVINWERKNSRPLSYLLPVLLTVVLLYLSLTIAVPRLLDTVDVLAGACPTEEMVITAEDVHFGSLQNSERVFFFYPWRSDQLAGTTCRVTYTPRSKFIIEVTQIDQTTRTP